MVSKTLLTGGIVAGVLVLYSGGDRSGGGASTAPVANASTCRVTVAADVLNVRAAPGTSAKIVGKLKRGEQVTADKSVQSGFRRVGENRWVSARYVTPVPGSNCG
jgi:uncharacterized protein YgiM (DUF1202 family)